MPKTLTVPIYLLSDEQLAGLIKTCLEVDNELGLESREFIDAAMEALDERGREWTLEDITGEK